MNTDNKAPEVLSDEALDDVNGGLPAVQMTRGGVARLGDGSVRPGDGSVRLGDGSVMPAANQINAIVDGTSNT